MLFRGIFNQWSQFLGQVGEQVWVWSGVMLFQEGKRNNPVSGACKIISFRTSKGRASQIRIHWRWGAVVGMGRRLEVTVGTRGGGWAGVEQAP